MTLLEIWAQFHWLRPQALYLIPLVLGLCYFLGRSASRKESWQAYVDPALLRHLLVGTQQSTPIAWWWLVATALLLACLSLAGPSWEKVPAPVSKQDDALIILMDLSPSMMVEDVKPSRLVRGRYKLIDLLNQKEEGQTALIAFAGEAHIVSPLTDDSETIINLLPALSPAIMPLPGSNVEMAVELGLKLLRDSGRQYGNMLLLSDGVIDSAAEKIEATLAGTGISLSVISVGTEAGGPIPSRQGFWKDRDGGIIIAKTQQGQLARVAQENGGQYHRLNQGEQDLQALQSFWQQQLQLANNDSLEVEREFDQWLDQGYWLVLVLLALFPLAFRRGWLLNISLAPLLFTLATTLSLAPNNSYAQAPSANKTAGQDSQRSQSRSTQGSSFWKDLWRAPDQRGMDAYDAQNYDQASELFENPDWRGSAQYQRGNYDEAVQDFSQGESSESAYNLGNAQAKAGQLDAALKSYDRALELDANNKDAKFNKELVEKVKEEQEKEEEKKQQDQENNEGEDQQDQNQDGESGEDGDSQESGEQEPQDQNSEQDGSESDDSEQESSEQESSEQKDQDESKEDAEEQNSEQDAEPQDDSQQQATDPSQAQANDKLSDEERQALEQWLQQVPDDPAGLLRNKFNYQYKQRRQAYRNGEWQAPANGADKRL